MVGNHTQRNIFLFIVVVLYTGNFADFFHNVLHGINLKEIVNTLHNTSKPFQAHTGIDIGVVKRCIVAVTVGIKLGKHEIPKLGVTVTIAANAAGFFAATVLFAAVKINFGTGSAGAGAVLPEVILFTEPYNALSGNADLLGPNLKSFIIIQINGDPKLINRHFHYFRAEFPSPLGSIGLKIVAEREIAEHFKKCAVPCRFTDSFNIGCTNALLAGGHALSRRCHLSGKVFFHRCHTGID